MSTSAGEGDCARRGVARPEEMGESGTRGVLDEPKMKRRRQSIRDLAHRMLAHSPSVSVRSKFFKFGSVCRISSARKSRSAMS